VLALKMAGLARLNARGVVRHAAIEAVTVAKPRSSWCLGLSVSSSAAPSHPAFPALTRGRSVLLIFAYSGSKGAGRGRDQDPARTVPRSLLALALTTCDVAIQLWHKACRYTAVAADRRCSPRRRRFWLRRHHADAARRDLSMFGYSV
jgi:hypothetical protein